MKIKTVDKDDIRFNPVANTFEANVELKTADSVCTIILARSKGR